MLARSLESSYVNIHDSSSTMRKHGIRKRRYGGAVQAQTTGSSPGRPYAWRLEVAMDLRFFPPHSPLRPESMSAAWLAAQSLQV